MNEIEAVIAGFENCTIERGKWGHPEHLILAYHYSVNHGFEAAYDKMKAGIFNLLNAFRVDLSREMPYHETMTVFWLKTVYTYAEVNKPISVEVINRMIKRFDKHYPGEFYSNDLLMSEKARSEYVAPDLKSMDD